MQYIRSFTAVRIRYVTVTETSTTLNIHRIGDKKQFQDQDFRFPATAPSMRLPGDSKETLGRDLDFSCPATGPSMIPTVTAEETRVKLPSD